MHLRATSSPRSVDTLGGASRARQLQGGSIVWPLPPPEAPSREVRPAGARVQPSWSPRGSDRPPGCHLRFRLRARQGNVKGVKGDLRGRTRRAGRSTAGLAAPLARAQPGCGPSGEGTARLVLVGSTHAPCGAQCRLRFPPGSRQVSVGSSTSGGSAVSYQRVSTQTRSPVAIP